MPQNGNDREQSDRPRRKVDRWDTLRVLFRGNHIIQRVSIGFVIKLEQPVFEDGSRGYPKLVATLNRDDRFLRFECFDGDMSEIDALCFLLGSVKPSELKSYQVAYDDCMADYRKGLMSNRDDGSDDEQLQRKRRRSREGW